MDLHQTAIHEMGHCLVCHSIGYPVIECSAIPENGSLGHTDYWCPKASFDHLTILVAGDIAVASQGLADSSTQETNLTAAGTDGRVCDESANALAQTLGDNARTRVNELIDQARERAKAILAENRAAMTAIVETLMRGEIIKEDHPVLKRIIRTSAPKI